MTEQNEKKLNVKSFELDHRLVSAPYIRVADRTDLGSGVEIIKYDLRFCQPNQDHLDTKALHSVEHMMANFMRNYTDKLIGFAPMGCRTGFYMSLIGTPDEQQVADAWLASMQDVVNVKDQSKIPELNEYQCGTYLMHSLAEAQEIAQNVLTRKVAVNKNEDLTLDESLLNA